MLGAIIGDIAGYHLRGTFNLIDPTFNGNLLDQGFPVLW